MKYHLNDTTLALKSHRKHNGQSVEMPSECCMDDAKPRSCFHSIAFKVMAVLDLDIKYPRPDFHNLLCKCNYILIYFGMKLTNHSES